MPGLTERGALVAVAAPEQAAELADPEGAVAPADQVVPAALPAGPVLGDRRELALSGAVGALVLVAIASPPVGSQQRIHVRTGYCPRLACG